MCNGKCGNCCGVMKTVKWLLIIGGINWGLVGVGMLMGSDWNILHMIFVSAPVVEGIIYILVGIAAIMKIFGCRCKKCMGTDMGNAGPGGMDKKM
jgi:uncharacterized membrane protein YuzA (DUF378 family)